MLSIRWSDKIIYYSLIGVVVGCLIADIISISFLVGIQNHTIIKATYCYATADFQCLSDQFMRLYEIDKVFLNVVTIASSINGCFIGFLVISLFKTFNKSLKND